MTGPGLSSRVGKITDVGIDRDRDLFVLDGSQGIVAVFRQDGSFLGQAPLSPTSYVPGKAIAVTPKGRVFVLTADGHEVIEFQIDAQAKPPGIRRVGSFPVSAGAGDICATDRSVFVVGFDSLGLVHQYGFDGRAGRPFGGPLPLPDSAGRMAALAIMQLGGHLACSDEAVAYGSEISPGLEVDGYDGRALWRSRILPYRGLEIRPQAGGGYSITVPKAGADAVQGVFLLGRNIVVQIFRSGAVTPHRQTLVFGADHKPRVTVRPVAWPPVRRVYGDWALCTSIDGAAVQVYRIRMGQEP